MQHLRDQIKPYLKIPSVVTIIFYLLVILILIKSTALRFSMPGTPFIDLDTEGYLGPALDMLDGRPLVPQYARGIYYPLFSYFNICISGSLNGIAFAQHLLGLIGLIMIVFSFRSLLNDEYPILKNVLVLLAAILLGFNYELIKYEHYIRPEGLLLFLSGSIFFLSYREYKKPGKSLFLLGMTITFTSLTIAKFAPACAVTGVYFAYRYITYSRISGQKSLTGTLTLSCAGILLVSNLYLNSFDEDSKYFLAQNFFYVNSRTIHYSEAFEKHFSSDEKQAIEIAINVPAASPRFPILGFDPDVSQYGPAHYFIENQYGKDIYWSVMRKSLVFCFPALMLKTLWQAFIYDFREGPIRMSLTDKFYYASHIADSHRDISTFKVSHQNSKIYNKYVCDLKTEMSKGNIPEAGDSIYRFLMYSVFEILSPFILSFFIFYSLYGFLFFKDTFPLALLSFHTLSLLTIALIHTVDIDRYCFSLFPFLVFMIIPGLYQILGIIVAGFMEWLRKNMKEY